MSLRFDLHLDRARYAPGERIRGTIVVLEGGRSRSLQVLLAYNERTDDYATVATSLSTGPLHTGDLTAGMAFPFELALPADALPNYRCEHGELYWELDVTSERFGPDAHERRRIEVTLARWTGSCAVDGEPDGA
jgi:hypothetical protein